MILLSPHSEVAGITAMHHHDRPISAVLLISELGISAGKISDGGCVE
jgi:hypothetical protein